MNDKREPTPRKDSDPAAGREIPRGTDEESESAKRPRETRGSSTRAATAPEETDTTKS